MRATRTLLLPADGAAIRKAAEVLRHGGLVAFPTETVYGLGVHALDREAVQRLFAAKGRPATDPLIVHVMSLLAAEPLLSSIPDHARELAARFWPGPLTLVMPRSAVVPDEVTAGLDTVAIRVPAHPVARALLHAAAIPLAAPSANLFSRPSPTLASHVIDDLDGLIDLVLDGGATTVGVESTVIDLSGARPTILRPGAVTLEMLREVIPHVGVGATVVTATAMRSPGLLVKHYSPRAPLTLYEGTGAMVALARDARAAAEAGQSVGVVIADEDRHAMSCGEGARGRGNPGKSVSVGGSVSEDGLKDPPLRVVELGSSQNLESVAANLYAALRELDASGVDIILVHAFPAEGLGLALQDRLRRAAAGRIVNT
jgi:L-threonylcarbamoyladenylate synthase